METVPNQNVITIHRQYPKKDFLQIKKENWQNMLKECKDYYALALYLYFASNADNYKLAISPAAIEKAIGMARSTYYKKFALLIKQGYIIDKGANTYEFYEEPQQKNIISDSLSEEQDCLSCKQISSSQEQGNLYERQDCLQQEQRCSHDNIEIHNINNNTYKDNINIINNNTQLQKQNKREFAF